MRNQGHSLRNRFRKLSIRWSLIGLTLTILIMTPTILAIVRHSSERQVQVMATALARAFRPMILHDQVRDAQLQMQEVTKLKTNESVAILDAYFKPIFLELPEKKGVDHCKSSNSPCWLSGGTLVSILMPIYFDDDVKSELYGYLVLSLKPSIDWFEIFIIAMGVILIFTFQLRGIYTSLKRESLLVEDVLISWKKRVDSPQTSEYENNEKKLFSEFSPLDQAIRGLHIKISELEKMAAITAATKAKVDIVRGIGHDLKTPLSQISKFFSVFVSNTKTKQVVDEQEVERIENSLRRMGSIIRQVTNLGRQAESPIRTDLKDWLTTYYDGLILDPEIIKAKITVIFDSTTTENISTMMSETDLFRIIDNLIRNAIESIPQDRAENGIIRLSLLADRKTAILSISDNGGGIPNEIQKNIFDLDFTTKKSRGTGLGLGIVKKICSDSALTLEFTSSLENGTTFSIHFPMTDSTTTDLPDVDFNAQKISFKGELLA